MGDAGYDDELEMELRRANCDDDPLIEEYQTKLATTEAALADANAEIERMKAACHHGSQTLDGPTHTLTCDLCGATEPDPFWRNPA